MRIVYFIILFKFVCNYAKNQGLTNSLNEIADMNNVLGAKNLLPNTLSSATYNNITFTHNSDDSITITGTSTVWTQTNINGNFKLPSGTYVMSTDTALTSDMYLTLRDIDSSTTVRNLNNDKESTPFTVTDSQNLLLYVGLNAGTYNITIKPMIRPASIQDDTYVPYSMTNRELTDNYSKTTVRVISVKNTSGTWGDSIKNVLDAFRALTDIPDSDKVYIYDLQLSYMHLNVINAEYREFSSVRSNVKTYNCVGSNNNPKHILNAKIIDSGSSVELNRFSFEDSSLTNISSYTSQGSTSIHFLQLHNV